MTVPADEQRLREIVHRSLEATSDDLLALKRITDERDAAVREAAELRAALERIAEQQQKTLATLRHHGIVFDGPLGNDPKNWQHVAFSIYTDLCEVDTIARAALEATDPAVLVADPAAEETGGEAVEAVDDFARSVQSVLYTPGLSDTETVNRITGIVDGHLAAEDRSDG